ncbi:MAG: tetratricopeptide repeat protein [Cellvibrio sp.]
MSLLNDMLRDLSHRNPVADGSEGYNSLLSSASFSQKKRLPWGSLAILFIIVFAAVLALNYGLHKLFFDKNETTINPDSTTAEISPDSAINSVTKVESAELMQSVVKEKAETPDGENKNIPLQSETLNNHISDLLQQAERAVAMERLTAPVEDNAYGYYQKILDMDSHNEDAKAGLDDIARRYLAKAQEQFALGNSQTADAFVQRARFVSPRFVQAHEITTNDNNSQLSEDDAAAMNIGNVQTQVQENNPTETIKPFHVVKATNAMETKKLSVSPNAAWKDEQLSQHAQDLLKQNKPNEALLALKNFVAVEKKPILSASLLADIYIQQGNTEAAAIIAEQANYFPADIKAKIKAQIFSLNGDNIQAIELLEKNLTSAENNEGYRSLLASLYHKTANYQQSVISYQRLINRFGDKPAYWLGLALAYDGLSQYQSALQAYQRLREFPQLQEQVTQYAEQRITALRSE